MENPAPAVFLYGAPEDYANYRAALTSAGLRPVVSRSLAAALGCEALLLPGGGDIHGSLPPEESFLLHVFWDAHRPILGICRGMQALNVFRGGTLHDRIAGHQQPSGDMLHPTCAEGPLASLLGSCPTVNSNHHQAVARLATAPPVPVERRRASPRAYTPRSAGRASSGSGAPELRPPPSRCRRCRAGVPLAERHIDKRRCRPV